MPVSSTNFRRSDMALTRNLAHVERLGFCRVESSMRGVVAHFDRLHRLNLARKSAFSPRDNAIIGQRKEVRPPRIQNVFKSPNQHPAPVTPVFRVHTQDISPRYPYIARRNCLARCTHRGHSRYCLWLPPSTRMAQSSLHATRRCTARARS